MAHAHATPATAWVFPALGVALYGLAASGVLPPFAVGVALLPVLFGAVFAAVHHAEVIGARIGEPYGTLVLSMAVTVIEVALIASVMLGDTPKPALARDTVFAVAMIVVNGVVGICILIGGLKHGEQSFRVTGASAYLTVLVAMSVLTLVMPNHTVTVQGPVYAPPQLAFISLATLALYAVFLYIQTIRHREHFLPLGHDGPAEEAFRPDLRQTWTSATLLLVALVAVILLSKPFAGLASVAVTYAGAPEAVIGVLVALSIVVSLLTFGTGRTNILHGFVHLVLFATFVFLTVVP